METELVHIGFNHLIAVNRVVAIASTNSSLTKRIIKDKSEQGLLIDMTNGRRNRAAIITDSGHIILAALTPEAIAGRLRTSRVEGYIDRGSSLLPLEQSDEEGSP